MQRYSRWEDAMIEQTRLYEFVTSDTGIRYMHAYEDDMQRAHKPEFRRPRGFIHQLQVETLRHAEPCYVSAEVTDIIDTARETFEPEPVLPSDPWTPSGFVLFPRGLALPDTPERVSRGFPTMHVRAIAWTAIHSEDLELGTFWLSYYSHLDDDPLADARDADGNLIFYDQTPEEYARHERWMRSNRMTLSLMHTFQWTWGTNPWTDADNLEVIENEPPEETAARGKRQSALAQTLWRIGSQVVPVKQRAPRAIWRDTKRKGIDQTDVNVITLRKGRMGREEELEPTGRHLKVQHVVRGHWRRVHTREGVRQTWVRPHLKGSDDLPFRETTRAWELKR